MDKFRFASKMEDVSMSIENLLGLGYAVYDALYSWVFTAATYEGAVFILNQEIERILEKSKALTEEMYAEARK